MDARKYLLLVDDNHNDLELAMRVLENERRAQKLVTAGDGVEALDFLYCRGPYERRKPGHPSAVLLDLKMPRVDGFEVLQQIKGDPRLKVIPVVMFTSSNLSVDVARCYELGANAYVVKPVEYREFVEKVKAIGDFWLGTNESPTHRPPCG